MAASPEEQDRIRGLDAGAISGQQETDPGPPRWNTYIWVDSADETAAKVTELGGTVCAPPFDVMQAGRMTVFADPQGAMLSAWEAGSHTGAGLVNAPGATPVTDLAGLVYEGRTELMDEDKVQYAQKTDARTLSDVIDGADVFLGLSAGNVLKPAMVAKMAAKPVIFALANPNPEIMPEDAVAVRPDAMICTGRSDFPNQVNNALCYPGLFRGMLDRRISKVTDRMKVRAAHAIAGFIIGGAAVVSAMICPDAENYFGCVISGESRSASLSASCAPSASPPSTSTSTWLTCTPLVKMNG